MIMRLLENPGCVLDADTAVNPKGGSKSQCATYMYVINLPVTHLSYLGG